MMLLKKTKHNVKIKHIENNIPDITKLATKTTRNAKLNEIKREISSITNLATTAALNAKIIEVKLKISNTTKLATTTALTAVKMEICNISNLVKKYDYKTKNNKIEKKTKIQIMIMINMIKFFLQY